jgi:hypothetical protein
MIDLSASQQTSRRPKYSQTKSGERVNQPARSAEQRQSDDPECLWPTPELVIYRHSLMFELAQLLGRAFWLISEIWNLDRSHETTERGKFCGCWEAALKYELPSPDLKLEREIRKFQMSSPQSRQQDGDEGSRKD